MATILGGRFPIATLNNGIVVANYGSNHTYTFTDGTVLGKCTDEVCRNTELISDHSGTAQVMIDNDGTRLTINIPQDKIDTWRLYVVETYPEYKECKMWLDVFINYQVSDVIQDDLNLISELDIINIILAPYPLVNAWNYETRIQKEVIKGMTEDVEEFYSTWEHVLLKLRTCKFEDRLTKIAYCDRFCGSEESRLIEVKRNPQLASVSE